jgi:hypothetical protein
MLLDPVGEASIPAEKAEGRRTIPAHIASRQPTRADPLARLVCLRGPEVPARCGRAYRRHARAGLTVLWPT